MCDIWRKKRNECRACTSITGRCAERTTFPLIFLNSISGWRFTHKNEQNFAFLNDAQPHAITISVRCTVRMRSHARILHNNCVSTRIKKNSFETHSIVISKWNPFVLPLRTRLRLHSTAFSLSTTTTLVRFSFNFFQVILDTILRIVLHLLVTRTLWQINAFKINKYGWFW